MTDPALITTMQTALCAAYPDEAWLVRDAGRLIKIELPHGTHTLCGYVASTQTDVVVACGQKLIAWREGEG